MASGRGDSLLCWQVVHLRMPVLKRVMLVSLWASVCTARRLHYANGQGPGSLNLQLQQELQRWRHLFESCDQHSGAVAGQPC